MFVFLNYIFSDCSFFLFYKKNVKVDFLLLNIHERTLVLKVYVKILSFTSGIKVIEHY